MYQSPPSLRIGGLRLEPIRYDVLRRLKSFGVYAGVVLSLFFL